jgi:hypothetical protein
VIILSVFLNVLFASNPTSPKNLQHLNKQQSSSSFRKRGRSESENNDECTIDDIYNNPKKNIYSPRKPRKWTSQCRIKLVGGPGPGKKLKSKRTKAKPREQPNGAAGDFFF